MYKIIPLRLYVHQIEYKHNYNTILHSLPIVCNLVKCVLIESNVSYTRNI